MGLSNCQIQATRKSDKARLELPTRARLSYSVGFAFAFACCIWLASHVRKVGGSMVLGEPA